MQHSENARDQRNSFRIHLEFPSRHNARPNDKHVLFHW